MREKAQQFEKEAQAKKQKVEHQVASLLKEGKKTEAIEMLTKFNTEITLAAQEFVKSLTGADKEKHTACKGHTLHSRGKNGT